MGRGEEEEGVYCLSELPGGLAVAMFLALAWSMPCTSEPWGGSWTEGKGHAQPCCGSPGQMS